MDAHEREPERCCFDDWVDPWVARSRKRSVAAAITGRLLDLLVEAGIRDRTVLDVGCGIGDLAVEAVRRGATGASGFDLSPKAIEQARELARRRGVADRTAFEVGDGARVDLPTSDVVVLNRVFCCYPHVDALLERSLDSAGTVYAFSVPRSTGLAGLIARVETAISNAWYRARESKFAGFRVFVHDVAAIDERVRAAGFAPVRRERRRFRWDLAVYARPPLGASGLP